MSEKIYKSTRVAFVVKIYCLFGVFYNIANMYNKSSITCKVVQKNLNLGIVQKKFGADFVLLYAKFFLFNCSLIFIAKS